MSILDEAKVEQPDFTEEELVLADRAWDELYELESKTDRVAKFIQQDIVKASAETERNVTEDFDPEDYKKDEFEWRGLKIAIENPQLTTRSGEGKEDDVTTKWSVTLPYTYGEFIDTEGADGDPVDVFVGPELESDTIFVIDQYLQGDFDETKVMIGWSEESAAKAAYEASYDAVVSELVEETNELVSSEGVEETEGVEKTEEKDFQYKATTVSFSGFQEWLDFGNKKKPFGVTSKTLSKADPCGAGTGPGGGFGKDNDCARGTKPGKEPSGTELVTVYGTDVRVFVNPTEEFAVSFLSKLEDESKGDPFKTAEVRGVTDGENIWLWNASSATHNDVAVPLGLDYYGINDASGLLRLKSENNIRYVYGRKDTTGSYLSYRQFVKMLSKTDLCGANQAGGGGFTTGNTCATGEGGTHKEAIDRARAKRAKASHKPSTAAKQRHALQDEADLVAAIGGWQTGDMKPFDVIVERGGLTHGIEFKTILDQSKGKDGKSFKVTVHKSSMKRKEAWENEFEERVAHMIVQDDRDEFGDNKKNWSGHRLYYKRGVGSVRPGGLIPIKSIKHLWELIEASTE